MEHFNGFWRFFMEPSMPKNTIIFKSVIIFWRTLFHYKEPFVKSKGSKDFRGTYVNTESLFLGSLNQPGLVWTLIVLFSLFVLSAGITTSSILILKHLELQRADIEKPTDWTFLWEKLTLFLQCDWSTLMQTPSQPNLRW